MAPKLELVLLVRQQIPACGKAYYLRDHGPRFSPPRCWSPTNSLKINDLEKKYMYTENTRFGRKLVWLIKLRQYFSQAYIAFHKAA